MLSRLHPVHMEDTQTAAASELRQVRSEPQSRHLHPAVSRSSSSSSSAAGVPDGGPQPAALPPGPVRRRAAQVDPLADGGPGGQHPGGAAEAGVSAALPAPQLADVHLDAVLPPSVRACRFGSLSRTHHGPVRFIFPDLAAFGELFVPQS